MPAKMVIYWFSVVFLQGHPVICDQVKTEPVPQNYTKRIDHKKNGAEWARADFQGGH
jgi:hypothetical protein